MGGIGTQLEAERVRVRNAEWLAMVQSEVDPWWEQVGGGTEEGSRSLG